MGISRLRFRRQTPRRSRAQALLEFALVLPITLLFAIGIVDFGRAFVFGVAVQQGAREAARLGANGHLNHYSNNTIVQRLIDASKPGLQGCTPSGGNAATQTCTDGFGVAWTFTVSPSAADGSDANSQLTNGATVTVTASGSMPLLTGFLTKYAGISRIQLQGKAVMLVL
jgi:Flp pilus assembly protein TadG